MKISTKTRYGMRFMLDLAQHYGQGCVALKDVASRQGISKKYLEQVISPLSAAGLLSVTRGQAGGYELARAPEDITLCDVVTASEDGLKLLDCMGELSPCEHIAGCMSQRIWGGMGRAMRTYLESLTLADVINDAQCALTGVAVSGDMLA